MKDYEKLLLNIARICKAVNDANNAVTLATCGRYYYDWVVLNDKVRAEMMQDVPNSVSFHMLQEYVQFYDVRRSAMRITKKGLARAEELQTYRV